MDDIRVSVIVPVYGVEKYLPACLDSVLGQTLREIEVICVDDASPDGCGRILDEYAARDARVKPVHLAENRRQGYGRNLGMEMAAGKYVYMMDPDDMIRKDALEELYRFAENDRLDGVFFDSDVIFEEERFRAMDYEPGRKGTYEKRVYTGLELFEAFYAAGDWGVYVWRQFWNLAYLREKKIVFPAGVEHEDESFSVEATVLADRVRHLGSPLAIHRYRAESVMTRAKTPRDFHGYYINFRELALFAQEHGIRSEAYEDNLAHMYDLAQMYFPLFQKENEPERWFRDPVLLEEYRVYEAGQRSAQILARKLRDAWAPLGRYEHIWLYGAGAIARRILGHGDRLVLRVEGLLVSSAEGNPESLGGCPVREIAGWAPEENTAVVLAVSPRLQGEILPRLRGKRCSVYTYDKGTLRPADTGET